MTDRRPVVLVLVDHYPPAYRAGGPTRSVPMVVERLADQLDFKVVSRDRDLGDKEPFPSVRANRWTKVGRADCVYLSPFMLLPPCLWWRLRRTGFDVMYVNSLFSISYTFWPLLLRRLGLLPRRPVVMSPRGELDSGALSLKQTRKRAYLSLARRLGLLRNVSWHATSEHEARRIRGVIGPVPVMVAPAMLPTAVQPARPIPKSSGSLRVAYLARIARMKNLKFALEAVRKVSGSVTFDAYGPIEDEQYWQECRRAAEALPNNVQFTYRGVVNPREVATVLATYHLFVLPTLGENFGHAIVEALRAGCLVLISDGTPWRGLEALHAGWDLPLDLAAFSGVVQACVDMNQEVFSRSSSAAVQFGQSIGADPAVASSYRQLFLSRVRGA